MPTCDLFKDQAFYPRRYFDDLMIEESKKSKIVKGTQSTLTDLNAPINTEFLNQDSSVYLPQVTNRKKSKKAADKILFGIG